MKILGKSLCFLGLIVLATTTYAECSFKVINHSNQTFTDLKAKASINNLAIPICTQSGDHDEAVQQNCAEAPDNILYSHPHMEATCHSTNGWPVYLQFEESQKALCTAPQKTEGQHIVVNYPEDFKDCFSH